MLRLPTRVLLLCCCLLLAACGGEPARVMVFAMDGPPLAVAGELGELELLATASGAPDAESADDPAVRHESEVWGMPGELRKPDKPDADGAFAVFGSADSAFDRFPERPAAQPVGQPQAQTAAQSGPLSGPKFLVRDREVFAGELERHGMVGNGAFMLKNLDSGQICRGEIKGGPGYKGRIRGIIPCGGGEFFMFTLNHHGPDQGAGIGRFARVKDGDAGQEKAVVAGEGDRAAADATPDYGSPNYDSQDLEIEEGPPLLFFYHPSMDEAKRRLADMQANLAEHLHKEKTAQVEK